MPFDELFPKTILKTSSDIYFSKCFENPIAHRKSRFSSVNIMHESPTQKSPEKAIRFRLLTKPSLPFFYMWDIIRYPYLGKLPFRAASKTTTFLRCCECHIINNFSMTGKSFHSPELRPVRHFEVELSIILVSKTETGISCVDPVTQHHRKLCVVHW